MYKCIVDILKIYLKIAFSENEITWKKNLKFCKECMKYKYETVRDRRYTTNITNVLC